MKLSVTHEFEPVAVTVDHRHSFDIGDRLDRRAGEVLGLLRDVFDFVARRGPRALITSALVTERGQFVSLATGDIREVKVDTKQKIDIVIVPLNRRGEPTLVENPQLTTDSPALRLEFDGTQDPSTKEIRAAAFSPDSGSGVAAVEFNADPKIGDEVGQLHGGVAISWSEPEATEVAITLGTPVDVVDEPEVPEEPTP